MKKSMLLRRGLLVALAVILLLISVIPVAAEENVTLKFLCKDIYMDGVLVNNYEITYPITVMNGSTYIPLSADMGRTLGFEVRRTEEEKLIEIKKTAPGYGGLYNGALACNLLDQKGLTKSDYVVFACEEYLTPEELGKNHRWREFISPIIWTAADVINVLTNNKVDLSPDTEAFELKDDKLIVVNDVIYIPLTDFAKSSTFGWSVYFDDVTGLYISTDPAIPAESYKSENNYSYIFGRAAYIRGVRKELSMYDSYLYEYIFRHESKIYALEQELLMAVSRTESSFQRYIRSSAGAVGMMQIMPNSAKGYGITEAMLEDPHVNIQFGTRYVRDRLWIYDGDIIKALSSYNQGLNKVNSGNYKTGYAEKCVKNVGVLKNWLETRGYSSTFETRVTSSTGLTPISTRDAVDDIPDTQIYK